MFLFSAYSMSSRCYLQFSGATNPSKVSIYIMNEKKVWSRLKPWHHIIDLVPFPPVVELNRVSPNRIFDLTACVLSVSVKGLRQRFCLNPTRQTDSSYSWIQFRQEQQKKKARRKMAVFPLWKSVWVCPHCGLTSFSKDLKTAVALPFKGGTSTLCYYDC